MALKKRRTSEATLAAERAFLREYNHDLVEVDRTEGFGASREVLDRLIATGMNDQETVRLIARCANQQELFTTLVKARKGTACWWRFAETVLLMPEEVWEKGGGDLSEDLVTQLVDTDLLMRIANPKNGAHKQILLNLTSFAHPLYGMFNFEPYWQSSMTRYADRGDFWRAWCVILKAFRGFFIADRMPELEEESTMNGEAFRALSKNRCCRARKPVLVSMVNDLFERMVEKGRIDPLVDSDFNTTSPGHYQSVWKGLKGCRWRETVFIEHHYPAKPFILHVGGAGPVTRRGGHRVRRPVRNQGGVCYRFEQPSAKANKIAQHFHNARAMRASAHSAV